MVSEFNYGCKYYQRGKEDGVSDEWSSPQWLVDALSGEFGGFDLDPCASGENRKAPVWFTKDQDGLLLPWFGKVWLNPPYSSIRDWMLKAVSETESGHVELVVSLIPAHTDTQWWREASASATLTRFLPRRLKFSGRQSAPFANAIMIFGKLSRRHSAVTHTCVICNRIFWGRRDATTCSDRCRMALSRKNHHG
jgi:phage N-6-adenine-methyltransferase